MYLEIQSIRNVFEYFQSIFLTRCCLLECYDSSQSYYPPLWLQAVLIWMHNIFAL
jgi:hypothetical protein